MQNKNPKKRKTKRRKRKFRKVRKRKRMTHHHRRKVRMRKRMTHHHRRKIRLRKNSSSSSSLFLQYLSNLQLPQEAQPGEGEVAVAKLLWETKWRRNPAPVEQGGTLGR